MWGELARSFQQGNGYLTMMLVLGFLAFVIIFERMIMLQFVYHLDFKKFLGNLKKMIKADDIDRAISFCKSVSPTSLPHITLKALEAADTDPTTVKGILEEETIEFLPKIESRINALPAIATLIMLIGILGTIDGLWGAFQSIDVLDTAKKQASLAQGIASSLNPTTVGLMICMILLALHQVLKSMAIRLTENIHHGIAVLHNLLVPAEVAAFVPMAAGEAPAMAAPVDVGGISPSQEAPAQEVASNDSFDDASVEDIKDEEEII